MFRIFDPIIKEIDNLVSDQVKSVQIQRIDHWGRSPVKVCNLDA